MVGRGCPRAWCGGVAVCWLDTESCRPRHCCWALGPLCLLPGRCCSRSYWRVLLSLVVLRGVVGAGLMPSSAVLVCTVGTWVPVGLLLGLVVIHPVRERRACCRRRPGHQGPLKEHHVVRVHCSVR